MEREKGFPKDLMFVKFCLYGFLKNLRFFDPFIILFFREMGMSFLNIGVLFSIREISTNILEIPTGVIADAYGRKKSMVAAFISYLLSFAIFYLFPNFLLYSIAMVLFASGEAFRSGTHKAMILEYLRVKGIENMKVEYYGYTRAFSQLGSSLSSLIALSIVFLSGSYRPVFLFSIIPYIFGLILILTYPSFLDGEISEIKGAWKERIKSRFSSTLKDFGRIFTKREALRAIFNSSLFDGLFKSSKDYLQPILKGQALVLPLFLYLAEEKRVSVVVGVIYFFLYLLTSTASKNASKIVKKAKSITAAINITYISGCILLLIAGFFTFIKIYWIAVLSFILLYIVQNFRRPINVAYISDNISHKTMASGLSVESQLKSVVMAILSPIIGYMADKFGVGIALVIISVIFLLLFPIIAVSKTIPFFNSMFDRKREVKVKFL